MADINLNNLDGIPFGKNAGRPTSPQPGQPYFNGEANRLEIYTESVGWQNIVQETPAVVNIVGALNENTSSTLTINGTNFAVGANVYAVGTNGIEYQCTSSTLVSVVQMTAIFPALSPAYEPYDIKVVNPSNLYGILYDAITVDNSPAWTTASGSLGTYIEQSPMSVTVSATDAVDPLSSALIYSISSGSLPGGLSINSSTGVISGTPTDIVANTTYNFTAAAYDGRNPAVTRNFSITITDRGPSWSTSATLPTFTRNSAYSTTLIASDDNGIASYTLFSGSLPTGLSLNSSTGVISGTPTSSTSATFTIRATDNGGQYVDRQFTMPNAIPVWVTTTLPSGVQNLSYSQQLSATDDSGTAPTYSLLSGSLPTGITLSSSGLLSGTPTTIATSSFTIRVTDANGGVADQSLSIQVVAFASAYLPVSFSQVTYSGGTDTTWTVPSSGSYEFEIAGANGGCSNGLDPYTYGGPGRKISIKYNLVSGSQVRLIAGSGLAVNASGNAANGGGQGGGGSFVFLTSGSNLIAAVGGGGGGSINNGGGAPYWYGTPGQPLGTTNGSAARNGAAGGTGGGDGNGSYPAKGWNTMIASNDFSSRTGWYGVASNTGGGGGPGDGSHAGGGGGGYSGGGAGSYGTSTGIGNSDGRNGGGGGGTYVNSSNRGASDLGTNAAQGYIIVRAATS